MSVPGADSGFSALMEVSRLQTRCDNLEKVILVHERRIVELIRLVGELRLAQRGEREALSQREERLAIDRGQ